MLSIISVTRQRLVSGLPWVWGEPVNGGRPTFAEGTEGSRLVTRSVEVAALPGSVFGWVCQLRRAPYSYDWVDNFGRRSPRQVDPALMELECGQSFMTIFELTGFEVPFSVAMRIKAGWPSVVFGAITLTYGVEPLGRERSRLSAVMWMPPVGRVLGRARRYLLAWGDLVMMRKQLRTLVALAERDTANNEKARR